MPPERGGGAAGGYRWDEGWTQLVDARLDALRGDLGPELAGAFERLRGRVAAAGWGAYFTAPHAQPVLLLPLWAAQLACQVGSDPGVVAVESAVESALVGYLHVRVQDDWLDEGVGEPAQVLLLSTALLVRHQVALARVCGACLPFWELFAECWESYGEAMLLEHGLCPTDPIDEALFRRTLRRADPMVLAAAALFHGAGLEDRIPSLRTLVRHLVFAHQLFHDLTDAERDAASGRVSWVLSRYSSATKGLRHSLFLGGGFDQVVEEALEALRAARGLAVRLGLDGAVAYVDWRLRWMEEVRQRVFRQFFSALLAPPPSGKYKNTS